MGKTKLVAPEENPGTKRYTGTFTQPPALCITEPYNDKDSMRRTAHAGKQLNVGFFHGSDAFTDMASHATNNGTGYKPSSMFKMQPSLTSATDMKGKEDKYVEAVKYLDRFPNGDFRPKACAKLGFLTADFAKRDEYSSVISTERLRETLKKETALLKRSRAEEDARLAATGTAREILRPEATGLEGQRLYDVVYRVPNVSYRYKRDDRQSKFFYMEQRKRAQQDAVFTGKSLDESKSHIGSALAAMSPTKVTPRPAQRQFK